MNREHARAEPGFQKRRDLGAAKRRLLHGRGSCIPAFPHTDAQIHRCIGLLAAYSGERKG